SGFRILQWQRGGPEIARGLTTGSDHLGQPVVVLAGRLHCYLGVGSIEHVRCMKDQDLLVDALLVEVLQSAVQIPGGADVDRRFMWAGGPALGRSQIDAATAKLHQMPPIREQRDLEWTIFQSFDYRDVTINIDDLHDVLLEKLPFLLSILQSA